MATSPNFFNLANAVALIRTLVVEYKNSRQARRDVCSASRRGSRRAIMTLVRRMVAQKARFVFHLDVVDGHTG